MKSNHRSAWIALVAATLLLAPGCSKSDNKETAKAPGAQPPPKVAKAAAGKNSFQEVTSHLDAGGNVYIYWGTADILNSLSTQVAGIQEFVQSLPIPDPNARTAITKAFEAGTRLIKSSGIEDMSGLGFSSIEIEKDLFQNKLFVHHYEGKGTGWGWNMGGKKAHALAGLDMLPATTGMAMFSDLDLPMLWTVINGEVAKLGIPEAEAAFKQLPAEFQKNIGFSIDQLMKSLGGEYGIILTADDTRMMPIPLPGMPQPLMIPELGLLIAIKATDDTIFTRVDQLLTQMPPNAGMTITKTDKDGLRMRTVAMPLPLPVPLRPSLARYKEWLFLGSTDTIIQDVVKVMNKDKKGWKASDEYKRLSQGMPTEGNSFSFVSAKFGEAAQKVQSQVMGMNPMINQGQMQKLQSLFGGDKAAFGYSISTRTADGSLTISKGNQDANKLILIPLVAIPVGAAVALPAFAQARNRAQGNAVNVNAGGNPQVRAVNPRAANANDPIIFNLRMLDGAKAQWALENRKKDGDAVTDADLAPYLRGGKVTPVNPPRNETYQLNPVGESPVAKLPDGSTVVIP